MRADPVVRDADLDLYHGDALEVLRGLDDGDARACVTSPPYLDVRPEYPAPTLDEHAAIFAELGRVVAADGVLLYNLGRVFRDGREVRWQEEMLRAAEGVGWLHLDTRVWVKGNGNPIHGNVFADRHEYVYVLGRRRHPMLNIDAIREPYAESSIARLRRGWTNHVGVKGDTSRPRGRKTSEPHPLGGRPSSFVVVDTGREKGNPHPAPMPLEMAEWMVKLASIPGDTVIDPFAGSGTTARACRALRRRCVAIESQEEYVLLAAARTSQLSLFAGGSEPTTESVDSGHS